MQSLCLHFEQINSFYLRTRNTNIVFLNSNENEQSFDIRLRCQKIEKSNKLDK